MKQDIEGAVERMVEDTKIIRCLQRGGEPIYSTVQTRQLSAWLLNRTKTNRISCSIPTAGSDVNPQLEAEDATKMVGNLEILKDRKLLRSGFSAKLGDSRVQAPSAAERSNKVLSKARTMAGKKL